MLSGNFTFKIQEYCNIYYFLFKLTLECVNVSGGGVGWGDKIFTKLYIPLENK